MITLICSIQQKDDYVTVNAVVEDAVQISGQSLYDPPEYGPAICEASFYVSEDEKLPTNDEELIEYLENLELDWEPCVKDWDY